MATIRQKVWNGRVNIRILLAPEDCQDPSEIPEYYISVRRIDYGHQLIQRVYPYFVPYLKEREGEGSRWWLEFENVPMKWNLPIGLLYDLSILNESSAAQRKPADGSNSWTLFLHCSNYPVERILPPVDDESFRYFWVNRTKESHYICYGNCKLIMGLSTADSEALWNGYAEDNCLQFWSVMTKLLPPNPLQLRNLPLRVYIPGANYVVQSPLTPLRDPSTHHSLGSALRWLLPELFPSSSKAVYAQPIIHGIAVPLHAPIAELVTQMMYPDGMLHVSLSIFS